MILMSQTEFGKRVGETQNKIAQMIDRGQITAFEGKPKKLIMPDAEKEYHLAKGGAHKSSSKQSLPQISMMIEDDLVENPVMELAKAKVIKERYLGKLHKQRYTKENGELVSLSEVSRQVMEICATIRNELINLPNKISKQLENLSGGEIQIRLTSEMNEVLSNLQSLSKYHDSE